MWACSGKGAGGFRISGELKYSLDKRRPFCRPFCSGAPSCAAIEPLYIWTMRQMMLITARVKDNRSTVMVGCACAEGAHP